MSDLLPLPEEFVIFDTEYTTWEGAMERGWSGPDEHRELVQLGAVKVRDLKEVDAFATLVRPVENPALSAYFTDLTGITQEMVDRDGAAFAEAYAAFMAWKGELPAFSYGEDVSVFLEGHELYTTGVTVPEGEFHNIKPYFDADGVDSSQYMSSTIPEAFGLVPPPRGHDALNDARSILLAVRAVYTSS